MYISNGEIACFIKLVLILMIFGLFLKQWKPPLPKQVVAGTLLFLGAFLGQHICNTAIIGFIIAGLIYYKHDLIQEVNLTKSCFSDIKEIKQLRDTTKKNSQ